MGVCIHSSVLYDLCVNVFVTLYGLDTVSLYITLYGFVESGSMYPLYYTCLYNLGVCTVIIIMCH